MCAKTQPSEASSAPIREQKTNPRSIRGVLVRLVANRFDLSAEAVTDDARFQDDLGLDSLHSIELLMAVEEEFEMDIGDDGKGIKTVGDAIRYIETKTAPQGKESDT